MIRFSRYIWLYALISGCVIVPGILSLIFYGLKPSIDFSGGTLFEVRFSKSVSMKDIENAAKKVKLELSSIQPSGSNVFILRSKGEEADKMTTLLSDVSKAASASPEIVREESVGPIIGKELLSKALVAAIIVIIAILCYVAYAFKNIMFGVAAVVSLVHDVLVMLGIFSLLGKFLGVEVDTLYVTAVLTTMSFSVHDTIVILDRIREYQKKASHISFEDISDRAMTETMGRSITNSMTIIFMLVALIFMGGDTVKWFSVALLVGTVSGTYSSPFIATPSLILINRWKNRKKK